MHGRPGFRCTWFDTEAPIAYWTRTPRVVTRASVYMRHIVPARRWRTLPAEVHRLRKPAVDFSPADVLVMPEIYGDLIANVAPGVPKVVFCQNAYYTFMLPAGVVPEYRHPDIRGVFVVSEDSDRFLRYAFPGVSTFRLRPSISPSIFHFADDKRRRIAFMPRKNSSDARTVIEILSERNVLKREDIVPIDRVSEAETARILRESLVFLSFGHTEGFGLPAAEAMSCGCIVVGYDGLGGREFFRPAFSHAVAAGDVVEVARIVERVIAEYDTDPEGVLAKGRAAAAFISARYSPAIEEADLMSAWADVLGAASQM